MSVSLVIANPYFPPHAPGGAEHSLEEMCRRFVGAGWRVRVVTNDYDGRPRRESRDGYEVEWVECPVRLAPGQQVDASDYTNSEAYHRRLADALVAGLNGMEDGPILIANNAQCYRGTVRAARRSSRPVVGIVRDTQAICEAGACLDNQRAAVARPCRGAWGLARCMVRFQRDRGVRGWRPVPGIMLQGLRMGWRRARLRREGLRRLDAIVTISDAMRSLVLNLPGMDPRQVRTIHNFHTCVQPAPSDEVDRFLSMQGLRRGRFFLFAGRKTVGKGADIAVRAATILADTQPDIRVLMLGREKLWIPAGPATVDHPSVPQSLLLGVLEASVALLIPGRWQEGLHRTMVDALHVGIPVIATEAGAPAVDGIIHGENGYVVACNDAAALAAAMERVLSWDRDQRGCCRRVAARLYSEGFSDLVLMTAWTQLLGELAGGPDRERAEGV